MGNRRGEKGEGREGEKKEGGEGKGEGEEGEEKRVGRSGNSYWRHEWLGNENDTVFIPMHRLCGVQHH